MIAMKLFQLPFELNASSPPERRGIRRDNVRLMALNRITGETKHSRFFELDRFLQKGDLLVLNASRTVPACLKAKWNLNRYDWNEEIEVRLAQRKADNVWNAWITKQPNRGDTLFFSQKLWATVVHTSDPYVTLEFNLRGSELYNQIYSLGEPVRYEYITEPWDLDYYQTVYATVPGSVEMPSAGRAFSWELLFKLKKMGIQSAFIQLHTGLTYLSDEAHALAPRQHFEEYVIPQNTANEIRRTIASGGRIIAVGTTVVRALEAAIQEQGTITPTSGWTNLHIKEGFPLRLVDGLITGFHEPEASHLDLLAAFIQPAYLYDAYREAIRESYLWHEFGDMNLII